jgi:hypothetical protein
MERGGSVLRRDSAAPRGPASCPWRFAWPVAALIAILVLPGCASISEKFASTMSQAPGIGLPDNAPRRPVEPAAYPAVHDIPPPRSAAVLTELEQQKLEDDLVAARQHQPVAAKPAAAKPAATKPVHSARTKSPPPRSRAIPVASGQAIY